MDESGKAKKKPIVPLNNKISLIIIITTTLTDKFKIITFINQNEIKKQLSVKIIK